MKRKIIILFLFFSQSLISQEKATNAFLIDYSYQIPSGTLSEIFSNNSSIGINYLKKNKSNFFYGLKANYIFGGEILKGFSFAMIVGVIVGTYSSIFVATPILNYTNVSSKTVSKEDNENKI